MAQKEKHEKLPNRDQEVAGRNWVESEESARKGRYPEHGARSAHPGSDESADGSFDADQSEAV